MARSLSFSQSRLLRWGEDSLHGFWTLGQLDIRHLPAGMYQFALEGEHVGDATAGLMELAS